MGNGYEFGAEGMPIAVPQMGQREEPMPPLNPYGRKDSPQRITARRIIDETMIDKSQFQRPAPKAEQGEQ